MTVQLRIYDIAPGAMQAFIRDWGANAVPVRREFGFDVVGAWTSEETDNFVWIVAHRGPEGFEEAARKYYDSDARANMAADPARHVTGVTTIDLTPVDVPGVS